MDLGTQFGFIVHSSFVGEYQIMPAMTLYGLVLIILIQRIYSSLAEPTHV